jgi:hypothetical protein
MPVGAAVAVAEGGGQVGRGPPALALGMLGGHRGQPARPGKVGNRGHIPGREQLRVAGHGQVPVHQQPAVDRGEAEGGGQRVGPHPDTPDQRAGGHELAVRKPDPLGGGRLDRGLQADLDPPLAQDPVGGGRQAAVQLGQHPRRQVQQQPAEPLAVKVGALAGDGPGQQLAVGGDLGAGVAGPDDHEGAARRPLFGVVAAGGQLQLAHQVVTQPQRLGEAAEAVGVLGDPGDRQQPVDAAGGQQQPVVGHRVALALRVDQADRAPVQVDGVDGAQHEPDTGQGRRQRHRHPPGIQDPGRHLGQQRQIEEVVGRVDEDHLEVQAGG